MKTCEAVLARIAHAGNDRVTSVELHVSVHVNRNGVSKPSYYCRAWRSEGPSTSPCAASAYTLDDLEPLMLKALSEYPTPDTDKKRKVDELLRQLAALAT